MRWTVAACVVGLSVACAESTGPVATGTDDYIATLPSWSAFAPVMADADTLIESGVTESTPTIGEVTYQCRSTPYSLTQTPDKVVTLDPDVNILWLGALLQGSGHRDGIGSLAEWTVRERAPLRISIDLLAQSNTKLVDNPNLGTVTQAIGELVNTAQAAGHRGGSSVSFSMQETHSVFQAAAKLGLTKRYLGSSIKGSLEASHSADKRTQTAYFVQRMFTVSMVLPNTPASMFSEEFTPARLQQEISRGHVGSSNPPVYVASIVYGRILMFSFTSKTTADSIRLALSAAAAIKDTSDSDVNIDAKLSYILTTAELGVVTVGGEGRNASALIRSGNLDDYFNEDAALTSARPISYTVRNLGDNSIAKVSETTEYDLEECTAIPTTGQLQIDVTPNDASVMVYGPGGYTFGPKTGDQLLTELTPGGYTVEVSRTGYTTSRVDKTVNTGEPTTLLVPLVDPNQTITGGIYTVALTRIIIRNASCAETYPDIFHEVRIGSKVLARRVRDNYLELQVNQWDHPGAVPTPDVWPAATVGVLDTVYFSNKGGTTTDTALTFIAQVWDNDGAGADDLMANSSWSYYKNQVPTGEGLYWTRALNGCEVRFEANITRSGSMFN